MIINDPVTFFSDQKKQIELNTLKCDFVRTRFPDVRVIIDTDNGKFLKFSTKAINTNYTAFEIFKSRYSLNIKVYTELDFVSENDYETIKITSIPESCRLIRRSWNPVTHRYVLKFSRFTFNMKKNNFRDEIFNTCRTEIMQFVQANNEYELDTKNLEPRLKKLLLFV